MRKLQEEAEGLILFLWLLAAWLMLREQPDIEVPVSRPRRELLLGLVAAAILIAGASLFYLGQSIFLYASLGVIYALPILVLAQQQDRLLAFGLRWPPKRAWLVLLIIIAINTSVGITLGNLLPAGELPTPAGADLAEELTSVGRALLAIGRLAIVAAIPEELFFRVYLQPRLSRFMPISWAILVQALLFSLAHLPQGLIRYEESWPIALAGVFTIPAARPARLVPPSSFPGITAHISMDPAQSRTRHLPPQTPSPLPRAAAASAPPLLGGVGGV